MKTEDVEHIEKNCVLRSTQDIPLSDRIEITKLAIYDLEDLVHEGNLGAAWALEYIKTFNGLR